MSAYYNEHDPKAAAWLRELINQDLIAPGYVDERSIEDVQPAELLEYTQCHFFAGIGVWSYALRQAGWPDNRPVWTGSCPCQPFSAAGKRGGIADERHLWPAFYHLLRQCKPSVVFGEQVASKDGLAWLHVVQADLEAAQYAVGAVDLCAASLGAPHIRQRLYWVADSQGDGRQQWQSDAGGGFVGNGEGQVIGLGRNGSTSNLANSDSSGRARSNASQPEEWGSNLVTARPSVIDGMADNARPQRRSVGRNGERELPAGQSGVELQEHPGPTNGFWGAADWLLCRDGKWRAVEPGTFPLANGAAARVGRLRGYGNAIVAQVAQAFIEAYLGGQS